jgi:hypothetical protein
MRHTNLLSLPHPSNGTNSGIPHGINRAAREMGLGESDSQAAEDAGAQRKCARR